MATPEAEIPRPVKVGFGRTVSFDGKGFEICTKRPLKATETLTIEWPSVKGLSLELLCCGGQLQVSLADGKSHTLLCSRSSAVPVYKALHRCTAKLTGGTLASPEEQGKMAGRDACAVDGGLLTRTRACCAALVRVLPWGSLATCAMTCDMRCVTAASVRRQEATGRAPTCDRALIRCDPEVCNGAFMQVVAMMLQARGLEDDMPPPVLIGEGAVPVQVQKYGAYLLPGMGSKKGISHIHFVPWDMVASVCLEAGRLTLVDRLGSILAIRGVKAAEMEAIVGSLANAVESGQLNFGAGVPCSEEFDLGRRAWQESLGREGAPELPAGCKYAGGVLSYAEGKELLWAAPLCRVDCTELSSGISGGRAAVVTETGQKLSVGKKLKQKQLPFLFETVRSLQFGEAAKEAETCLFGIASGESGKLDSALAACSLRLTHGSGTLREWDLARVVSCEVEHHGGRQVLLVRVVNSTFGERRVYRVPMPEKSFEEAAALAQLIKEKVKARVEVLKALKERQDQTAAEAEVEAAKEAQEKAEEEAVKDAALQAVEDATKLSPITASAKAEIFNAAYDAAEKALKGRYTKEKDAIVLERDKEKAAKIEAQEQVEAERKAKEEALAKTMEGFEAKEKEARESEAAKLRAEEDKLKAEEEKTKAEEQAAEAERKLKENLERAEEAAAKAEEESKAKFLAESQSCALLEELQVVKEQSDSNLAARKAAEEEASKNVQERQRLLALLAEMEEQKIALEKRVEALSPKVVAGLT